MEKVPQFEVGYYDEECDGGFNLYVSVDAVEDAMSIARDVALVRHKTAYVYQLFKVVEYPEPKVTVRDPNRNGGNK